MNEHTFQVGEDVMHTERKVEGRIIDASAIQNMRATGAHCSLAFYGEDGLLIWLDMAEENLVRI